VQKIKENKGRDKEEVIPQSKPPLEEQVEKLELGTEERDRLQTGRKSAPEELVEKSESQVELWHKLILDLQKQFAERLEKLEKEVEHWRGLQTVKDFMESVNRTMELATGQTTYFFKRGEEKLVETDREREREKSIWEEKERKDREVIDSLRWQVREQDRVIKDKDRAIQEWEFKVANSPAMQWDYGLGGMYRSQ
jgi:hypothetical protein